MIYFDNSATTPVCPEAANTALRYMTEQFYNPAAAYSPAVSVERDVNAARARLASYLNAEQSELIFTSGGTESNNIALSGTLAMRRDKCRIITSAVEHPSVFEPFAALKAQGYDVVVVGVDKTGCVRMDELSAALTESTGYVSIMHVNNEVGAVNDINGIYHLVREKSPSAVFHCDGVQAYIKMPAVQCDMYSFSGHKLNAPKGIGGLYVRRGTRFKGGQTGGGQENNLRSGTTNVPSIMALDVSAKLWTDNRTERLENMTRVKHRLYNNLSRIKDIKLNGPEINDSVPYILNISFLGVRGEVLLHSLMEEPRQKPHFNRNGNHRRQAGRRNPFQLRRRQHRGRSRCGRSDDRGQPLPASTVSQEIKHNRKFNPKTFHSEDKHERYYKMERVILVRYTEIHLKGLNRPYFEQKLVDNMRSALRGIPSRIDREHGRIYVMDIPDVQFDEAISRLTRVFGIHSVSPALAVDKDWQSVCSTAYMLMDKEIEKNSNFSFKVFARRSDKHYFMNSDGINRELGHLILERYPSVRVDIHKPEVSLSVEIRDRAYLYCEEIPCANGMPVGTAGRATLLISGGIDSPVAGYMMAKRGLILSAVHFYSYPYTSERARDKVVDLTRLLSRYAGPIRLHLVPFTDIQMTIYEQCPSKETTVIMRRLMMKIAQRIAEKEGARALITGEALGQVASQTLESLCVTNDAVTMPVFRPLIGFDKDDIMDLSRKIGTYETSILPYEDCCTVFVPKHPVTKPVLEDLRASEAKVDFSEMIEHAISDSELMIIK